MVASKIAEVLGVSLNQLHGLLIEPDGEQLPPDMNVEREASDDPMRRRTLLRWSLAATASAGLGGLDVRAGNVGTADIAGLQRAAVRLHNLDQQYGGETLWQAATGYVNEAYFMLEQGTYTETVGQQLLRIAGRLQICAGWLAFDAGQQAVARTCYTEALALGRQAADAQVETRALANLAFQSNVLGRPREALRIAVAAEQAAACLGEPSSLPAIPHLRQAIACALVADTGESDRAITQARNVLDRGYDQPTE